MESFKNADVCCFCSCDGPLITTIVWIQLQFDDVCVVSVCMGHVCQGQIVPISLIRASKNGCFCGGNTGSKRRTACFKYDTCNMLWYVSSVCVCENSDTLQCNVLCVQFQIILAVMWFLGSWQNDTFNCKCLVAEDIRNTVRRTVYSFLSYIGNTDCSFVLSPVLCAV